MNPDTILVLVLTTAAVIAVIWMELKSRRNTRADAVGTPTPPSSPPPRSGSRKKRGR